MPRRDGGGWVERVDSVAVAHAVSVGIRLVGGIGGGVSTIRQFRDADLVDTMHVAVSPVKLGSGLRLWESPDELLDRFHKR